MDYFTAKEVAKIWRISTRRVQILCLEGRIDGAMKMGNLWIIPKNTEKPKDKRKNKVGE